MTHACRLVVQATELAAAADARPGEVGRRLGRGLEVHADHAAHRQGGRRHHAGRGARAPVGSSVNAPRRVRPSSSLCTPCRYSIIHIKLVT